MARGWESKSVEAFARDADRAARFEREEDTDFR